MDLHIIDGNTNPDPMTVRGTKDLVAMFYALNPQSKSIVKTNWDINITYVFRRILFLQ